MNQLNLNLELANSEEHEYRGFTIVLHESIPKRITDRYAAPKDERGRLKKLYWQTTETTTYWQATIYKKGDSHSGRTVVSDAQTKSDALLMIKTWIDIWRFGEREKYKVYR